MTVKEYIENNPKFELIPFISAYRTIIALLEDGIIPKDKFESVFGGEKNA